MADDMQTLINQQAEITEYKNAHLEPLVRTYVRNYYAREANKKCWRLCDMWFTAFLMNQRARYLWEYQDGGHELHMKALRQWHASLLRDEALDDFHEQYKLQHDVPPRVEDAEDILATLVAGRRAALQSGRLPHTQFDMLVVETDSHLLDTKRHKTYTLYCLWLTYIV
jgi:FMN phosphatase YigB (HAD superfamily)